MNNLQLAVNTTTFQAGDTFSGVAETQDLTVGDPSMNLAPKFEALPGRVFLNEDDDELPQVAIMDQYSGNYNHAIRIEEEGDTIGDGHNPYSSSSDEEGDEFDELEQDDGQMIMGEDEGDFLIDGAGQQTIEVLQDIERMVDQNKEQYFLELMEEREIQMLSQEVSKIRP